MPQPILEETFLLDDRRYSRVRPYPPVSTRKNKLLLAGADMAYQFLVNEEEHTSIECFRKWFFAIFQHHVDIAVLHIPHLHTPIFPPDVNKFLRKCAPNMDTC